MSESSILARLGIMNDERPEENKHPLVLLFAEPCGWWPPLLPVCILFLEQNFAPLILRNGELCAMN